MSEPGYTPVTYFSVYVGESVRPLEELRRIEAAYREWARRPWWRYFARRPERLTLGEMIVLRQAEAEELVARRLADPFWFVAKMPDRCENGIVTGWTV